MGPGVKFFLARWCTGVFGLCAGDSGAGARAKEGPGASSHVTPTVVRRQPYGAKYIIIATPLGAGGARDGSVCSNCWQKQLFA